MLRTKNLWLRFKNCFHSLTAPAPSDEFSSSLTRIYNYYARMCSSPFNFQRVNKFRQNSRNKRILCAFKSHPKTATQYVVSRCMAIAKAAYLVLILLGFFEWKFGKLDVFSVLEIILWMVTMLFYTITDQILLNLEFVICLTNSMKVWNEIWNRLLQILNRRKINRLKNRLHLKVNRLFFHASALDYFQMGMYAITSWGTLEYRTNIYSVFPWKSFEAELISWFLEWLNLALYTFAFSYIFVVPSLYAVYTEICIETMTESISHEGKYPVEEAIEDYKRVSYAICQLGLHISNLSLLVFCLIGFQQTIQCYCVFQIIKLGGGFKDYGFMLLDMVITTSRICHSLYGLSVVDMAGKRLLAKIRSCWTPKFGALSYRKLLRIQPVNMRLGSSKCKRNLILAGMSAFLDYYTAAALWPTVE